MSIHLRDSATARRTAAWPPGAGTAGAGGGREAAPADRPGSPAAAAEDAVTELYQAHALRLIRLAYLMLGDRGNAEDVVQEAFCGLYRRWGQLSDSGNALRYVHSSVVNGCRSALRRTISRRTTPSAEPPLGPGQIPQISAEAAVLSGEERQQVMAAVRRLPPRQREALVLRFYLDLPEEEIAAVMGIGQSTVRSATHRALASLARMLREDS
jgi:RNA polymerase sigma-70 factor (sigma-E family)